MENSAPTRDYTGDDQRKEAIIATHLLYPNVEFRQNAHHSPRVLKPFNFGYSQIIPRIYLRRRTRLHDAPLLKYPKSPSNRLRLTSVAGQIRMCPSEVQLPKKKTKVVDFNDNFAPKRLRKASKRQRRGVTTAQSATKMPVKTAKTEPYHESTLTKPIDCWRKGVRKPDVAR